MRSLVRLPLRRTAAMLAVSLLGTACSGPTIDTAIGVREQSVDIIYGDGELPPPPPPPPAADPSPAFPGFIQPPAPRTRPAQPTPTTSPPPPPAPCPEADPLGSPDAAARPRVDARPVAGSYRFRQRGQTVVDDEVVAELPAEGVRVVTTHADLVAGVIRYDVAITEFGATTVTTYEVDQRGIDDGVYIAAIRTDDGLGTQAFAPTTRIKVLPIPVVIGQRWSSAGTDPIHGTTMSIHGRVLGKERVDACGTWIDAWQVVVGRQPDTDEPSRIIGNQRSVTLEAEYRVATQMGGLIVADDVRLDGREGTQPVLVDHRATISSPHPVSGAAR